MGDVQALWKRFYAPMISQYSHNRKKCINIRLCSMFNDLFDLFDDNALDKYNEHWQQALFYQINQDKEVCIVDNGALNEDHCSLIAELFEFDQKNADIVRTYFELLWKWFIGKELIKFRKDN